MVMVYDMNSEIFVLCGVILMFLLLIGIVSTDESPTIKNEEIIYKDISHISNFGNDITYYNVYTEHNKFKMTLEDYNELNVGDNLTVSYNNQSFIPYTYYNNNMYFSK